MLKMDFIKLVSKKVSLGTGIETEVEIGTGSKDFEQKTALHIGLLGIRSSLCLSQMLFVT